MYKTGILRLHTLLNVSHTTLRSTSEWLAYTPKIHQVPTSLEVIIPTSTYLWTLINFTPLIEIDFFQMANSPSERPNDGIPSDLHPGPMLMAFQKHKNLQPMLNHEPLSVVESSGFTLLPCSSIPWRIIGWNYWLWVAPQPQIPHHPATGIHHLHGKLQVTCSDPSPLHPSSQGLDQQLE